MPDPASDSRTPSPSVWRALASFFRLMSSRRRSQLITTLLLMLAGTAAELVTIGAALPFLAMVSDPARANEIAAVRTVFDLLGWQSGEPMVAEATLLLVAAALLAAALRLLLTWTTQSFAFRLGHDISVAMFSRALYRPYLHHVERNSSELIAGVEKAQAILFSVLLPLMQGLVAGFIGISIFALLIVIDPFAAMVAGSSLAGLYFALSAASRPILTRNSRVAAESQTLRIKLVQEGVGGIRDILLDRSQPVFVKGFREVDDRLRRAARMNMFLSMAPRMIIEAGAIILIAILALYMSGRPGGVVGAIPVLGALAIGAQRLLPLLQTVYVAWSRTAGSLGIVGDVTRLLDQPASHSPAAKEATPAFADRLELDAVRFRYPGADQDALAGIDLCVRKGERIGLIGPTGSGKSTLLDLVMGLLEPGSGAILVDGTALDRQSRASWQARIAHVPQFIYLSDASIAENIAFGTPPAEIDMVRVADAARRAQAAEFIEELPDSYSTRVGERGVRLSGGQRQRIGIARALYKHAPVLILDEATSALDDSTEAAVIRSLAQDEGLTIVMVAHRISSLSECDRLIRLEHGRATETPMSAERLSEASTDGRRR